MKLAHRYLLTDFLGQFFLWAIGISIFMLGFVLYREASSLITYRVPIGMIFWLLLNRWPLVILDVMPGAGLFAVILSLGRMVREREFQVFRLSGWSFTRIIWPLLALTLLLSYSVFIWNDRLVPLSERQYAKAWTQLTRQQFYNFVTTDRFIAGPDNTQFYIGSIDRKKGELKQVMVYQENPGKFPRLITAATGRMDGQIWTLRDGVVHEFDNNGYVAYEIHFAKMTVNTKRDWSVLTASSVLAPTQMNRAQLREAALKYDRFSATPRGSSPATGYWLDYHLKLASPFALFIFTALAIPFAFFSGRTGRLAIFLPALLLYLGYFLLLTVLYSMGSQGVIQPWLAAWGCNIFFGTVAGTLLLTVVR